MGSATFPWAEWNTRNDPEALRIVLDSGVPLYIVGLNVTLRCILPLSHVQALANRTSPEAQLLSKLIALWQRGDANKRPQLHDPLAVAAVARPHLLTPVPARFGVICEGPFRGWSCAWPCPDGKQRVALSVRPSAFLDFFTERVIER